jgi:hypothetical protein
MNPNRNNRLEGLGANKLASGQAAARVWLDQAVEVKQQTFKSTPSGPPGLINARYKLAF